MKIKKILPVFFITLGFLSSASIGSSETKHPTVRFNLKTDSQIYKMGEEITISGLIKNLSSQVVYIQTMRPFLNTQLTVKTPSNKEALLVDERGPFVPTDYYAVLPTEEIEYFTLKIRADNLEDANTAGIEPFTERGTYEISYIYQDLTPTLKKALKGTYASRPLKIDIVSLENIQQETKRQETIITKGKQGPQKDEGIQQKIRRKYLLINKKKAIALATEYIKRQKAYRNNEITFLFISDSAENNYWVVGFEEAKSGIFHAIKVHANTGEVQETYFLE